jgi:hypothetical protein
MQQISYASQHPNIRFISDSALELDEFRGPIDESRVCFNMVRKVLKLFFRQGFYVHLSINTAAKITDFPLVTMEENIVGFDVQMEATFFMDLLEAESELENCLECLLGSEMLDF